MDNLKIKKIVTDLGAEDCGIANAESFSNAPEGFKPQDIYPETKSVIAFVKSMPQEILNCSHIIPYTNTAFLIYQEVDRIGLALSRILSQEGIGAVAIPCDTPYLHWEAERMHGQGILSMRHTAHLAGLGYLGKNTLLIHKTLGNSVYIGAILVNRKFDSDQISNDTCPINCHVCLEACPQNALDGITVIQKLCRAKSFYTNQRGFTLYDCRMCRQVCPRRSGYK